MKNLNSNKSGFGKVIFSAAIILSNLLSLKVMAESMSMKMDSMEAMEKSSMQGGDPPADARDPNAYSDGYEYRGMAGWEETDEMTVSKIIFDQLEYRDNDDVNTFNWDMQGWIGTDYKKFWVKFEGEDETSSSNGELELQMLYSQAIAPFWDFQLGIRYDTNYGNGLDNDRFFAVVGVQGLAPYWFEVEPTLFISEDGDVSARIVTTYDLLFTQKLILQPRLEINVAASKVSEFGIGKGLNDVQFGLRLRYEIRREIAPYAGLSWTKNFGDTADFVRAEGGDINNLALVAGIRLWF